MNTWTLTFLGLTKGFVVLIKTSKGFVNYICVVAHTYMSTIFKNNASPTKCQIIIIE